MRANSFGASYQNRLQSKRISPWAALPIHTFMFVSPYLPHILDVCTCHCVASQSMHFSCARLLYVQPPYDSLALRLCICCQHMFFPSLWMRVCLQPTLCPLMISHAWLLFAYCLYYEPPLVWMALEEGTVYPLTLSFLSMGLLPMCNRSYFMWILVLSCFVSFLNWFKSSISGLFKISSSKGLTRSWALLNERNFHGMKLLLHQPNQAQRITHYFEKKCGFFYSWEKEIE